jgi:glycosyltransferase involved in cell wall biosynthesis
MHWHVVHHARGPFTRLERDFARRRLSWSRDAVYILGVGRLSRVKRFPMLLDAVAKLGEGDIRLVLLGEGDRQGLERQAQNLGLHHRVEFAVTDDVALYLCAADIYVSTSSSESFGLANLEALQAGLPCICTAVGGVPEVVGDGACLVAGNVNAISDAIRRLISDPVLRAEYANRARLRAANWPDINAIAIRYEQIYTG